MAHFADGGYPPYNLPKGIRTDNAPKKSYYRMILDDIENSASDDEEIIEELSNYVDEINQSDFVLIICDGGNCYEINVYNTPEEVESRIKDIIDEDYQNIAYIYHKGKNIEYEIKLILH